MEFQFEVAKIANPNSQNSGYPKPGAPQLLKLYPSLDSEKMLGCHPNDCLYVKGMRGRLHLFGLSFFRS